MSCILGCDEFYKGFINQRDEVTLRVIGYFNIDTRIRNRRIAVQETAPIPKLEDLVHDRGPSDIVGTGETRDVIELESVLGSICGRIGRLWRIVSGS